MLVPYGSASSITRLIQRKINLLHIEFLDDLMPRSQIQNIIGRLRKQEINSRLPVIIKHEGLDPKPAEILQHKHDHVVP